MEDLNAIYTSPEITSAQGEAQSALNTAGQYQSAASLLPTKLKEAIQEKLDYNKDLIEEKNKAMEAYFQAPSKAREQYQTIWNPFQREALVTQARTQAYTPYANLTDILKERQGTIADVVNAGTGAFNSAVTAEQNQATLARQKYADLIDIADKLVANKKWEYEQTHKEGSGATDFENTINLAEIQANKDLNGDGLIGGSIPVGSPDQIGPASETQPDMDMSGANQNVTWKSPGGQWIWDKETNQWVRDLSAII